MKVQREKIQWAEGRYEVYRRGWGGSAALAEGSQIEQWRNSMGKSQCCLQKKQGRSRGSSSKSASCQEF